MLDGVKQKQLGFVRGSSAYEAMRREVDMADGHAFVFHSPDTLLSHLLCYMAAAGTVCGDVCFECRKCVKVFGGSCTDIIDCGEGKVMTEDVDKLLGGYGYSPYELPYKFYFLNFSERNDAVQNKLLKVLEEPSASAKFIIITSSLASLLPTVKSRCAVFEPKVTDGELLKLEDEDNPNLTYARYAARGNMTEFYGLLGGNNVDNLLGALNIARGIDKSPDMVRLLKYLPTGGAKARQKFIKTLGYLEMIYGDLMAGHCGVRVSTYGVFDLTLLKKRIAPGGLPEALTTIRRAVKRSEGGNLTSVADELILKLTEINYNSGIC